MIPLTVFEGGMNSGLMNKSWEYPDRADFINRFSGDIGIINNLKEAGFKKMTMFMQSPLSKGKMPTFNPLSPDSGATLTQRVLDCVDYAKYIEQHKPLGINVAYALIDAFPQKNSFGDRQVYR